MIRYEAFRSTIASWLFLFLLLFFPFQKKYKCFSSLSRSLIPEGFSLPASFSRHMSFYFTDFLILALTCLCLYQRKESLRRFFFEGPAKYLTFFFGVGLISLFNSISATYAVQYYRFFHFFLFALLFCSIVEYFRFSSQTFVLRRLFWVVLFSALVECGIAIAQYFLQHSIGLRFLGESNISHFSFPMAEGHRWVFDSLLHINRGCAFLLRASGTFPHPNVLGCFLFFSLLITYSLFILEEKKLKARFLQWALFIELFTLCLTYSRAAILAGVLGSCIWAGLMWKQKMCDLRKLSTLAGTVLCGVTLCLTLFYSQFFSRGGIVNYNAIVQHADSERLVYQKVAWKMFQEHPLLGVGFNNFKMYAERLTPAEYPAVLFAKVHNIYLLVLAEMGLCGLLAFSLFLYSVLKAVFKHSWNGYKIVFFSIFMGFLCIGGCDFYFLDSQHGAILFFGVAALLYASSAEAFEMRDVRV